ncbi:sigma-54-dependent Fis family transcriptional regulator [bacterium]|nr:sigma-54-dependent Fis family transcriptional regulator [bacterium]
MNEARHDAARVLIADDEESMRFYVGSLLARDGLAYREAADGEETLQLYRSEPFDLVILDYNMPKKNGLEVLSEIMATDPQASVIVITAWGDRSVAVEALSRGALDYFSKPFDNNEMRIVVKRALERRRLLLRVQDLSAQLSERYAHGRILGGSAEMRRIYEVIERVAGNDVTVLICGESGTGKELVARAIHHGSPRKDGPFVPVNCAAIPDTLLESELFGYEKGAFTGAESQRKGKFELAEGGTLFLDEIGDMNQPTQAKILRALQEKEFARVGGHRNIKTDIRVVAATNKDLAKAIEAGEFREDLYYRLNVVTIYLPPLRRRLADIPLLVEHFIKEACKSFNKDVRGVSAEVLDAFAQYRWPGNVRELENMIQRAVVLAGGPLITLKDLPLTIMRESVLPASTPEVESPRAPLAAPAGDGRIKNLQDLAEETRDQVERAEIGKALAATRWRRGAAAELLGISRRSLLRKMKKYGLE